MVRDGAVLWIASVTPIAAYCAGALGPQARKPLAEKPSSDGAPGC